ncbi:MAG: DUF2452 domain-containing protein [Polyangiaceae bacterium]
MSDAPRNGGPSAEPQDRFTRHEGPNHEGLERASPYPVSRLAPVIDLVDVAREIQAADAILSVKMTAELSIIAEQIRALQERARAALAAAEESARLHRATCSFKKRPGHVYHLYRKTSGGLYFSMLSPEEWGGRCPDAFEGSYRLEIDMTFARV